MTSTRKKNKSYSSCHDICKWYLFWALVNSLRQPLFSHAYGCYDLPCLLFLTHVLLVGKVLITQLCTTL